MKSKLCCTCNKDIIIKRAEYDKLQHNTKVLNALYAAGVDNWEGYEFALEGLER
jgi:hypothetical protein